MIELQGDINIWTITSVQTGSQNLWALNQFVRKKKTSFFFTFGEEISNTKVRNNWKFYVFPAVLQWLLISLPPDSFLFLPIFHLCKYVFIKPHIIMLFAGSTAITGSPSEFLPARLPKQIIRYPSSFLCTRQSELSPFPYVHCWFLL